MPDKPETVDIHKLTRQLPVELTDAELLDYGATIANAEESLSQLEEEEKAYKAQVKAKRESLTADVSRLAAAVRAKSEHREVQCEELRDWGNGRVLVVRMDTGQTIEDRTMPEGMQRELELRAEQAAAAGGTSDSAANAAANPPGDTEPGD